MAKKSFDIQDKERPYLNRYSLSFILDVVSEIENGKISIKKCREKYGIKGQGCFILI